ncbi:MAG: lipase family protein [Microscillaceae bacterium]|nr:lipase family protein [Microscillaceae bacterium]
MNQDLASYQYFAFEPRAQMFSPQNALSLAKFSALVYDAPGPVALVLEELWGLTHFQDIEDADPEEDTQAFVAANDDIILIGFRGTESKREDWFTNINFSLEDFQGGKAHRGFVEALAVVWPTLLESLVRFQTRGQSIWLTGHSLGGALAVLCADLLVSKQIPVQGVYTFGQPRVGDADFARVLGQRLSAQYFRVVNEGDYVSFVPPEWFGFAHAGQDIVFNTGGEIVLTAQGWESWWQDTYAMGQSFWNKGGKPFREHGIQEYVYRLALHLEAGRS